MSVIDGRKMAEDLKTSLKGEVLKLGKKIRLAVVKVGEDPVRDKFLEQKKKFGGAVGIDLRIYDIPKDVTTNQLRKKLAEIMHIKENPGVIVQLPLPSHINTQYILDGIIPEKDPDMLSSKSFGLFASGRNKILPPVVAAVDYIFKAYSVQLKAAKVAVIGAGRLVGKPVVTWLMNQGATVSVLDENTKDISKFTKEADIVISGVGKPNLITADMVKEGVIAIDCGTSLEVGLHVAPAAEARLLGDFDPAVAKKASFFTPVPGGVGPLTIAMLFKNLVELARKPRRTIKNI